MAPAEFGEYRRRAIEGYAAQRAPADNVSLDQALERARKDTDRLLPEGLETPDMLILVAETEDGERVGDAWVSLLGAHGSDAWIYAIEVDPKHRGQGYGRALLEGVAREVAERGRTTLGLNVFGGNTVARSLYESAGFEINSLHMVKTLTS
jgi:ribosomal protein S18 acetylase RimI-like enzyme